MVLLERNKSKEERDVLMIALNAYHQSRSLFHIESADILIKKDDLLEDNKCV